jgi:hypothetical protein
MAQCSYIIEASFGTDQEIQCAHVAIAGSGLIVVAGYFAVLASWIISLAM